MTLMNVNTMNDIMMNVNIMNVSMILLSTMLLNISVILLSTLPTNVSMTNVNGLTIVAPKLYLLLTYSLLFALPSCKINKLYLSNDLIACEHLFIIHHERSNIT